MIAWRRAFPFLAGALVLLLGSGGGSLPLTVSAQISAQIPDQIPGLRTSARSQAAEQRVRAALERDLLEKGLDYGAPVFLRIFKAESELEVWVPDGDRFVLFRSYPICSWSGELGPKLVQGDLQAPEGFYFVKAGSMNPTSNYHLSFNLGYPNAYDRRHGRTGGALMVHGNCVSIGCYAMTDAGIDEIYTLTAAALRGGQSFFRVHIFPFRMTFENLERYRDSPWSLFWKNLKEGHDWFLLHGRPPDVVVHAGEYCFEAAD